MAFYSETRLEDLMRDRSAAEARAQYYKREYDNLKQKYKQETIQRQRDAEREKLLVRPNQSSTPAPPTAPSMDPVLVEKVQTLTDELNTEIYNSNRLRVSMSDQRDLLNRLAPQIGLKSTYRRLLLQVVCKLHATRYKQRFLLKFIVEKLAVELARVARRCSSLTLKQDQPQASGDSELTVLLSSWAESVSMARGTVRGGDDKRPGTWLELAAGGLDLMSAHLQLLLSRADGLTRMFDVSSSRVCELTTRLQDAEQSVTSLSAEKRQLEALVQSLSDDLEIEVGKHRLGQMRAAQQKVPPPPPRYMHINGDGSIHPESGSPHTHHTRPATTQSPTQSIHRPATAAVRPQVVSQRPWSGYQRPLQRPSTANATQPQSHTPRIVRPSSASVHMREVNLPVSRKATRNLTAPTTPPRQRPPSEQTHTQSEQQTQQRVEETHGGGGVTMEEALSSLPQRQSSTQKNSESQRHRPSSAHPAYMGTLYSDSKT